MYAHERSLVKRLEDKPFALLGVNSDANKEELKKAMEKEHITWRSILERPRRHGRPDLHEMERLQLADDLCS